MSGLVKIDVEKRLVHSALSGHTDDQEFLQQRFIIKSHPDFDPSFSEIVDFTGVTGGEISNAAIRNQAERETIYQPTSKHVVVCPMDLCFGLARMFQVYAEHSRPNFTVVRSLSEAYVELGLKPPQPAEQSGADAERKSFSA
jgi:hypothetical protein